MKKREGEKEGKVEETGKKKNGGGERVYTEYPPHRSCYSTHLIPSMLATFLLI